MNSDTTPPPSIPSLLKELRDETSTLLRQEVALAKTEMRENVSHLTSHALHVAIGGFVAYAGVIVLLIGIGHLLGALLVRAGVDANVATWAAPSAVGLLAAVIGWAMVTKAKNAMTRDDFAPKQTIASLRENKQWVQNKLHHSS